MTKAISLPLTGIVMLATILALMAFASIASAHQAATYDPAEANCMGKLTSFHAKDDGGINNSAEMWPHTGIGGPHDGSVQEFQKLSQAWCMSE